MQELQPLFISSKETQVRGNKPVIPSWLTSQEEGPLVQFLNQLLMDAITQKASDLHFEPYEDYYRIRMRQDGILYEMFRLALKLAPRLTSRLKVMSQLDISECRRPQDGRFKFPLNDQTCVDFRISSCPTLFGEKIVLRLQDPRNHTLQIDGLGLEYFQKELLLKHLNKPQGMILVTGPTGSGKSLSLYTAIRLLNTLDRNISSCEDPVEIYIPGINQVNANFKIGLTFAMVLRAFLRQDPDVIMIGEIRDLETAEMAIKAAQTGHLVLSSLHTNSASESITRLSNMGIPHYLLASCLSLVIAQRLVRRLCEYCKVQESVTAEHLAEMGCPLEKTIDDTLTVSTPGNCAPSNCDKCKQGYSGRIGVYEFLPVTPNIQQLILQKSDVNELHRQGVQEGMWDLRKSAFEKVKQGITSINEIYRVIN